MKLVKLISLLMFYIPLLLVLASPLKADENTDIVELEKKIQEYSQKINELQRTAGTLANQIQQFDTQITITELKIGQTEEQIVLLGGRIDQLQNSMTELEEAYNNRVVQTYKMSRSNDSALVIFSSSDVNKAVSSYYYLHKIQEADKNLLDKLQKAHTLYVDKKDDLEDLEKVLGVQKEQLDNQKSAKSYLLKVTKNDEKEYQKLLAETKAEYEAIQAIIAGRGVETEAGHVGQGQRIASIIQGASCNSNGTHTHFIVASGGAVQNPFNFLRSGIDYENCSGPSGAGGECLPGGDTFNPSGSWDWPINAPIKFNQGYGYTWAIAHRLVWYGSHNGIDINSKSSSEVKAVQAGDLYQGSYTGNGGCRLRYVRVDHDNSDLETYYLHINY